MIKLMILDEYGYFFYSRFLDEDTDCEQYAKTTIKRWGSAGKTYTVREIKNDVLIHEYKAGVL